MKKILSLLLAVVMLLSLCACGKSDTPAGQNAATHEPEPVPSKLLVGFGKVCITPEDPVQLNGYTTNRTSDKVLDDIYITCIAMKSEEETALIFSQDTQNSSAVVTPNLRQAVGSALDVPQTNIFVAATGTYSGPNLKATGETAEKYMEFYLDAAVQAATQAMDDLAPSVLYSATTEVEGLNFVHHYKMVDGTVEDGYYGFFDREIEGHVIDADKTMRLVKAERDGKPAILLVNWQCRPTLAYYEDKNAISADFIGYMRNKIEADTGMKVAYFTGAYGDLSPTSKIESEDPGLGVKEYGEKLAEYAINAQSSMAVLGGETIGAYSSQYKCPVNHLDEDMIDLAKQVTSQRKALGDQAADKLAKQLGFRSVYHAANISSRINRTEKYTFEVAALRMGNLGMLMSPSPIFNAAGKAAINKAPTDFTFIICEANAAWEVLPTEEAFSYGGYETDVSYFAKGSAEFILRLANEMLLTTTDD